MTGTLEILKSIMSVAEVVTILYKLVMYIYNKAKKNVKEELTVSDLCDHVEILEKKIEEHIESVKDHDNRIDQCEKNISDNHSSVMLKLGELSKEVQEFRHDSSKIMTKLIETINNVTMKA